MIAEATQNHKLSLRIHHKVLAVRMIGTPSYPLACIQTPWLKTKSIAWVMSITGLGKVVSDQNPFPCNHG